MSKEKIRVSTYAKRLGCSTTEVYRRIKDKRVEVEVIDGVQFVIIEEDLKK